VLREPIPSRVVVAREGAPLLLGLTDDGCYAASDASALVQVTRRMVYLENGDCAELTRDGYRITRVDGTPVERAGERIATVGRRRRTRPLPHYMQKEIFEQPVALANTLEMLGTARSIQPGLFGASQRGNLLKDVRQVLIIACGTSYHAGLVARYWLESIAGIPCSVEVASEYRYRDSVPDPADAGGDHFAIRRDRRYPGRAAPRQVARHAAYAVHLQRSRVFAGAREQPAFHHPRRSGDRRRVDQGVHHPARRALSADAGASPSCAVGSTSGPRQAELHALRHLPIAVTKILELEPEIREWAEQFSMKQHALFLGRGRHYPIAMEGALKLKEISYIHAEAYPAGELKHGPLALVDRDMPVIAVAPNDALLEKLKSNLQEVRARGGELYVFADADSEMQESDGIHVLHLPEHYGALSALLHVVPLQLLAYHVALVRGTDVDKPRNLAKSVTVE
jgi:glucosamine--fructose-6-phosphate aminotransferase (isomerizing)